jgi:hypothetical protein
MEIKEKVEIKDKRRISLKETLEFTPIEKDILKELLKTKTKADLLDFYIDHLRDKSYKIKSLATDYNIKSTWAEIALEIAKKLMYRHLRKGTPLMRNAI